MSSSLRLVIQRGEKRVTVGRLPAGDAGVAATVAAIQATIDHALTVERSRLRRYAQALDPGDLEDRRDVVERFGQSLWAFLRRFVRFKRDPRGVEFVRHPGNMLDAIESDGIAKGDCDDLATLGAAIVAAAGLRPVLVTVGRRNPGRWEHIFFGIRIAEDEALTRDNVYPLDPQERNPAGTWPSITPRVQLWSLTPSTIDR